MKTLTVLYDARCGLCGNCRRWLEGQAQVIPLEFLDVRSATAARRYPGLDALRPSERMIVVADTGELWQGEAAWIMCLHALRDTQAWAARLAHPALHPIARALYGAVSRNRHGLSSLLHLKPDTACPSGACASTPPPQPTPPPPMNKHLPARRTAWFFSLANIPLGLAGAWGLFLLAGMSVQEWSRGRVDGATGMLSWVLPSALAGTWLWWNYFRCARGRLPADQERRLWRASTGFNALGIAASGIIGLDDWGLPALLWFVLATGLSARAWWAEPKI